MAAAIDSIKYQVLNQSTNVRMEIRELQRMKNNTTYYQLTYETLLQRYREQLQLNMK